MSSPVGVFFLTREPGMNDYPGALEEAGLSCRVLEDPETALEALEEAPPAVLVLDLGADSLPLLSRVRALESPAARALPTLLMASPGAEPPREDQLRLRLDEVLFRPFPPEELARRVRDLARLGDPGEPEAPWSGGDLLLARAVQRNLLPLPLPERPGVLLAAFFLASEHLSGDFFDVVPLDRGATGFFLADVVGHGTAAALFTSFLKGQLLHWPITLQARNPEETLWDMNQALCQVFDGSGRFVTALQATYEPGIQRLQYANAGHPPLFHLPRGEPCALLEGAEIPLGVRAGVRYRRREIRFAPGDRVFLLTDGILEQPWRGRGEAFGKARVAAALESTREAPLEASVQGLRAALGEWAGDQPFQDDLCLLGLEASGP